MWQAIGLTSRAELPRLGLRRTRRSVSHRAENQRYNRREHDRSDGENPGETDPLSHEVVTLSSPRVWPECATCKEFVSGAG